MQGSLQAQKVAEARAEEKQVGALRVAFYDPHASC